MKKILLVDDDGENLSETACVLKRRYEVVTAGGSDAALELLDASFSLVLSDFNMPGHDGLWLAAQINGKFSGKIPVVIMSGAIPDTDAMDNAAIRGFLQKPIEISQLFDLIEAITKE